MYLANSQMLKCLENRGKKKKKRKEKEKKKNIPIKVCGPSVAQV